MTLPDRTSRPLDFASTVLTLPHHHRWDLWELVTTPCLTCWSSKATLRSMHWKLGKGYPACSRLRTGQHRGPLRPYRTEHSRGSGSPCGEHSIAENRLSCMVRDAFVLDLSYFYLLALRLVAVHRPLRFT